MNILVVKLSDIGDVLTVTPALRAIRRGLPDACLTILVPPSSVDVVEGSPLVDQVLVFDKSRFDRLAFSPVSLPHAMELFHDLRSEKYDAVAVMHHLTTRWGAMKYAALAFASGAPRRLGLDNGRGWFLTERVSDGGFGASHEVEYWLAVAGLLGARLDDYPLEMSVRPEDEAFADERLPQTDKPTIALHPGSGEYSLARRWPVGGFIPVGKALLERYGARLVIVGGRKERELAAELASGIEAPVVNLAGETNVRQLGAVLKRCRLFIGSDSGVMHLAVAARTPAVAIFGPSNHRAWGPWTPKARSEVVRVDLPCSPCLYVNGRVGNRNGCPQLTCQELVTPEMVLASADRLLSR